ncbi:MAG: sensory rhodopsin transducer [Armatimonadota bacterium]
MPLLHYRRPGTFWHVGDGLIWDNLDVRFRRQERRPLECSSRLLIYNPQRRAAAVTVRFFHTDRAPTAVGVLIQPRAIESLELSALDQVPHRQSFWMAVSSDVPVLPQARHEDYTFWDRVPDALISTSPYPGPLTGETCWVFPDCYESDPSGPWYELETLTILNPNKRPASVRVRYLLRHSEGGAEEEIEVGGERVAQLDVWERRPRPIGRPGGPPVHVSGDYAVRIDSTRPVIAQTTRRARWSGYQCVIGARSTMGFPCHGRGHTLWYYPGGAVIDRGILPRAREQEHPLSQSDNSWNLLFINNPDDTHEAHATIAFHRPGRAAARSGPIAIAPLKSDLQCLHGRPWLGSFTRVGEPFAIAVSADRPVVPEVTCAEFEMWSQVMPGAMSAVNLYPGPLRSERTWWLGVGPAGGADDEPLEWAQSYHLFNQAGRLRESGSPSLDWGAERRLHTRSLLRPGRWLWSSHLRLRASLCTAPLRCARRPTGRSARRSSCAPSLAGCRTLAPCTR